MTDHRPRCAQCNQQAATITTAPVELPDGTFHPTLRVCRARGECRDRWWARLAYELELI